MLRTALIESGFPENQISIVVAEQDAVNAGLEMCQPGDLLLLFCDQITRTWKQVIYFGSDRPETHPARVETPAPTVSIAEDSPPEAPPPETEEGWGRDTRGVFLVEED